MKKIIMIMLTSLLGCSNAPIDKYNREIPYVTPHLGTDHYKVRQSNSSVSSYNHKDNVVHIWDITDVDTFLHEHYHYISRIRPPSKEFKEECIKQSNTLSVIVLKVTRVDLKRKKLLQDVYSALSRGRVQYPYQHSERYWTNDFNVWNETYANLLTIYTRNYLEDIAQIKRDYPEIIALFERDLIRNGMALLLLK